MRLDGRKDDELRQINIDTSFLRGHPASALVEFGNTRVICAATVEDYVPRWLKEQDRESGWVTAEYSMLPFSSPDRTAREAVRGKLGGRTHEIQRLIGRSLRTVVDLKKLKGMTIWVDCDVIEADGGTRTASITGGFVALYLAVAKLIKNGSIKANPIKDFLAAVSSGIVKGNALLDLDYQEDFAAEVDMNIVMTGSDKFVEIQGTGEEAVFSKDDMDKMLSLSSAGIKKIMETQKKALGV
ncbi:MAG: ribonuclease PH [Candidatus Aureabacteria bacterium]|nr:ribonuclease PH [Candidatus Auribacterota bacterium]